MRKITNKLKDHFVPHKGNNHEPHFLRHEIMTLLLYLIIIVELVFLAQVFFIFKKDSFLATVLPGVLTNLTNQARLENGVLPLTENQLLKQAAQMKANDMAKKGYFAHTSPEGITPWYWLVKAKYKYSYAGENLAVNFFESEEVAKAWMASPTHRANIVRKEFTEIGIATASGVYQGHDAVFVVQFFGKPIASNPKPILTDTSTTNNQTETTKTNLAQTENKLNILGEEIALEQDANVPEPSSTIISETVSENPNNTIVEESSLVEQKDPVQANKNSILKILASPRKTTSYIFYIILAFVFAVFVVFLFKSEKRHPEIIWRSTALMFVILTLLVLNLKTLHIDTVLPDNSEVNIIAS